MLKACSEKKYTYTHTHKKKKRLCNESDKTIITVKTPKQKAKGTMIAHINGKTEI